MARKRNSSGQRGNFSTSTHIPPSGVLPANIYAQQMAMLAKRQAAAAVLTQLEDRRRYNPTKTVAAPRATRRSATRLVDHGNQLGWAEPFRVAICTRRAIRRQIMFAIKKTGKGARAKRNRNYWSDVRC